MINTRRAALYALIGLLYTPPPAFAASENPELHARDYFRFDGKRQSADREYSQSLVESMFGRKSFFLTLHAVYLTCNAISLAYDLPNCKLQTFLRPP